MMTPKNTSSASGAAAALAGYDYQLDVSVLAALRLMLVNKSADKITLEPANEEDLEADLAPDVPGRVLPSGQVAGGYKLVVQVKLSNGEPWSLEDFDQLLNYGVTRKPAREHLDDLNTRYLLVTNAGVKGVALKLIVSDFEEASDPKKFPPKLKKTLRKKPEGRVAIWGSLGERQLDLEIDRILGYVLRIPHPRHKDCRQALREEAKRRMRGSVPGEWTKEDLLSTVRSHGGYMSNMVELEYFVEPANFQSMVSQLDMRNAIVITGSSGTGKTWAALALCDRARRRDGAVDIVTVRPGDGPSAVRRLAAYTGPTLFYIEDPWGQYTLQPQGETWTEHLPRLLMLASPSHQYVITSRHDMLRQTEVSDLLKPWTIELNAETELIEIYLDAKRRRGDWRDIVHHPRVDELRRFWVEEAFYSRRAWVTAPARFRVPASEDEIGALLEATHGTRSEALAWNTACLCWATRFEARLAQRLWKPGRRPADGRAARGAICSRHGLGPELRESPSSTIRPALTGAMRRPARCWPASKLN